MRSFFVMVILLFLTFSICTAATFETVRVRDYEDVASRVVLAFSGKAEFQISKNGQMINVLVQDCSSGSAQNQFTNLSRLVSSIDQNSSGSELNIKIVVNANFQYEFLSMFEPFRIVIDIYQIHPNPSRQQRLVMADFFAGTGRLQRSDDLYAELHRKYGSDPEISYKWALLLKQRGNTDKALQQLGLISNQSTFYTKAQQLISSIKGNKPGTTESRAQSPEPRAIPEPQPNVPDSTLIADSLVTKPEITKTKSPSPTKPAPGISNSSVYLLILDFINQYLIMFLLVLGVSVLALVFLLFRIATSKKVALPPSESRILFDQDKKKRMIMQLVHDGWRPKEIARELGLSRKEVESIIDLCQSSGAEDYHPQ